MDHLRFGFAAGCEAAAIPRRRGAFTFLGYTLGAAFGPNEYEGAKPEPGAKPGNNLAAVGGA